MIPPPEIKSFENWQSLYRQLALFRNTLQTNLKEDVGLTLHLMKAGILLPSDAPDPDEDIKALFPPDYFKRDGMVIAGAPIGTDLFIESFIENSLAEAQMKLDTIARLPNLQMPSTVQAAIQLLISSGTKLLSWIARVVPPKFTLGAAKRYDQHVQACLLKILSPQNRPDPPECSKDRLERALEKATLPPKHQGLGLATLSSTTAIQWWFSVAGALKDKWFTRHSQAFSKFSSEAYDSILQCLGSNLSTQAINEGLLLPTSHRGLLSGFYQNQAKLKGKMSMSLKLTHLTQDHAKWSWLQRCDPSQITETGTLTRSDVIISNSRSYAGLAITAELSDPKNRVDNDDFIAWVRYWLNLPQLPLAGNAQQVEGSDTHLETCQAVHTDASRTFNLDIAGNHIQSCPAAKQGMQLRHSLLKHALMSHATEAGLIVSHEPATRSLLLGQFSKEICNKLFPKNHSKTYRECFDQVFKAIEQAATSQTEHQRMRANEDLQAAVCKLESNRDGRGIRLDLSLKNPITSEEEWIDTTVIHSTADSYITKEFKHAQQMTLSRNFNQAGHHDVTQNSISPAVSLAHKGKLQRYSALMKLASHQHRLGKRSTMPLLTPFVVSDVGEMNEEAIALQQRITAAYKRKLMQEGPRPDGQTINHLTSLFRAKLRVALQMAIVKGLGAMLRSGGHPFIWG